MAADQAQNKFPNQRLKIPGPSVAALAGPGNLTLFLFRKGLYSNVLSESELLKFIIQTVGPVQDKT